LQATGKTLTAADHPIIRNAEGCYASSSMAVELAKKHDARLHILHISTAKELELFTNAIPMKDKRITAEACIHHLWFTEEDYSTKGNYIKWNPAVKSFNDRMNIREAVNDGRIDVIATDHAPHPIESKDCEWSSAAFGMLGLEIALSVAQKVLVDDNRGGWQRVSQVLSQNPAAIAGLSDQGQNITEIGSIANLVIVDPQSIRTIAETASKSSNNPYLGLDLPGSVVHTIYRGYFTVRDGKLAEHGRNGNE
jgi:dihydroorotase